MIVDALLSLGLTSWILLVLSVLSIYYYLTTREPEPANLPPTPGLALPIVGHGYLVKKNPVRQFREWRKTLGDVYMLYLGKRRVVVLNGYDTLKQTLVKQADKVSDRPPGALRNVFADAHHGILTSSGPNWKEQRTTSLSILREFGMGKNILAEKISQEVDVYMNELTRLMGKPTDLRILTNVCVSNIICSIIFGQRYDLEDQQFLRLMDIFNENVRLAGQSNLILFMPWLRHLPGDFFNIKKLISLAYESREFTEKIVNRRLQEYAQSDDAGSFAASYVKEMEKKRAAGISTHLDESNLHRLIGHLFIAGTETTSNTIIWCLLFMLHNPKVQEKVFQEIKEEIGTDRLPTMADKPRLKYLTATIMETQRMGNILPLNLNHLATAPIEIKGYTIPAGSTVMPILDSVLMDENLWENPETFRPERFLDKDGNVIKREELVPFSLGRRICLGEALAKMELFLYLAAMFQRFQFLPEDPKNLPPVKEIFGATCAPEAFKIRWVERKA